MKSLKCPNCGGPIDLSEDDLRTACPYCGAALERTLAASRRALGVPENSPVAIEIGLGDPRSPRRTGRLLGCIVFVVLAIAGSGIYVVWRGASIGLDVARRVADAGLQAKSIAISVSEKALPLERLSEASFHGRHAIAAAPPTGGFAALEPVGALPWALAIAQRWASDAAPWRIDVERLRPDGTVNLADDAHAKVTYRFASPRRLAVFRERANRETEARGDFEFWVTVESGTVSAYALETLPQIAGLEGEEIARLTYPKSLPLPEILAKNARRKELPEVPYYKGYLIQLEREGWCWYLSTLSGTPSIPRFRARDGRMWPY